MPNPKESGNFRDTLETLFRTKSSPVAVFSDFVRIAACAVSCQQREEEYHEVVSRYKSDELKKLSAAFTYLVNEMQKNPFADLLGEYYQTISSKAARDGRGEFFTPELISELVARISLNATEVIERGEPVTMNEPACGSGGMILQLAKQLSPEANKDEKSYVDLLRVTAQDISPLSCDMTLVNTSLWGIPTRVILGNTLENEVLQTWKNIHWRRVGEDWWETLRMMEQVRDKLPDHSEIDQQPSSEISKAIAGEQMGFDF